MGWLVIDVMVALTLIAMVFTGPADVSADSRAPCPPPGTATRCGALGHDSTDALKTCLYLQGGLAPAVGPYPCLKAPHLVGIDRRAILRPHPLSPYRERSNFGRETAEVAAVDTEPSALVAAEEPWVPEIEAP